MVNGVLILVCLLGQLYTRTSSLSVGKVLNLGLCASFPFFGICLHILPGHWKSASCQIWLRTSAGTLTAHLFKS